MHVKQIKSNIKGGVDQALGEKTLIVGPNGHGKSAIVNAVELALGGTASDIVGRAEVKRELDLLALGDGKEVSVEAILDDDSRATYEAKSNGRGGAKKASHVCPVHATFPVRDVRAALGGSSDTARSWLLEKVVTEVTRNDVVAWFTPEATELYESMARDGVGEITNLLAVVSSAAKEGRAKKKRLKSDQELLERLGANLDAEPSEKTLSRVREEEAAALTQYEEAMRASGKAEAQNELQRIKAQAEEAIERTIQCQTDWNQVREIKPLGDRPTQKEADLIDRVQALKGIHQMHIDLDMNGHCLVCEQSSEGINHTGLMARKEQIIQTVESRASWWDAHDQVRSKFNDAQTEAERAIERYHEAKEAVLLSEVDAIPLPEAKALWEAANMKRVATEAAEGQWKQLRSQKDLIRELRQDISNLEELVESGKQAVNRLLTSAVSSFTERVQSYLPEQDVFKLVLEQDGKEVCRFGLERDGQLHTALSGAEWARLTLALACASATGKEDLLVFTPEERAFDPKTLRDVMAALSDAPGQVILTSPIKHKGRLPKGWTVVEIEEAAFDSTQTEGGVSLSM